MSSTVRGLLSDRDRAGQRSSDHLRVHQRGPALRQFPRRRGHDVFLRPRYSPPGEDHRAGGRDIDLQHNADGSLTLISEVDGADPPPRLLRLQGTPHRRTMGTAQCGRIGRDRRNVHLQQAPTRNEEAGRAGPDCHTTIEWWHENVGNNELWELTCRPATRLF